MPDVRHPRRYCLLRALAAERDGNRALALAWRGSQHENTGTALDASFPSRAALVAAGYSTLEDIRGADASELVRNAGLTRAAAQQVLSAAG